MDEVDPSKESIKSNIETKDKNTGSKKLYANIVIHGNKRRHDVGLENWHNHRYKNYNVRPNLFIIYDGVSTRSCCNPYNILDAVVTQGQTLSLPSDKIRIGH